MVAQMRRVKRVEKTADNMKTFFTSSIGPMSMKVISAPGGSKLVMLLATIASDDEHWERMNAITIATAMDTYEEVCPVINPAGRRPWMMLESAAPINI